MPREEHYPRIISKIKNSLFPASEYGFIRVVKYLIELPVDSKYIKPAITTGIMDNNLEIVKLLDPSRFDSLDDFLTTALSQDRFEIVKYLAELGADFTDEFMTLPYAVYSGNIEIVKFVLDRVTDIYWGSTIGIVGGHGKIEMVRFLLSKDVIVNHDNLYAITRRGKWEVLKIIVEKYPELLVEALHAICLVNFEFEKRMEYIDELEEITDEDRIDMIKMLMDLGAVPDNEALRIAIKSERKGVVKFLSDLGVSENTEV